MFIGVTSQDIPLYFFSPMCFCATCKDLIFSLQMQRPNYSWSYDLQKYKIEYNEGGFKKRLSLTLLLHHETMRCGISAELKCRTNEIIAFVCCIAFQAKCCRQHLLYRNISCIHKCNFPFRLICFQRRVEND